MFLYKFINFSKLFEKSSEKLVKSFFLIFFGDYSQIMSKLVRLSDVLNVMLNL